jgi:transcription elongation factor Elf1
MTHSFDCPECGREHDEPAEAAFVLAVRCGECDLRERIDARERDRRRSAIRRAA